MADVKISQLPQASLPLTGTEIFPLVQNGTTVQAPIFSAGSISSISELRNLTPVSNTTINLDGYYTSGDGGGGLFYAVTGAAAGTYVDNGGTIIVPTGGDGSAAWLRIFEGSVDITWFGAIANGVTDCSTALQSAIDVVFTAGKGGVVYIPPGDYAINTTINLTNFDRNAVTNIPVLFTKRLKIVGAGSGSTRLIGGEVGYGFFEFLGANFLWFEGFSIYANRDSNYPQYGFCGGRNTGNASSGLHTFIDVFVTGKFSFGGQFMLSSEVNTFDLCVFYPQIGHGCIMAMNNIPWGVTPKYSTFGTGLGGNGANLFQSCQFLGASQNSANDVPLALEFAQAFRLSNCYWATTNNTSHIYLRKSASGTIDTCFFERYGSFDPYSIYFAPDDPLDPADYIDYRDINVTGCRMLRIFADTNTRITNMYVESTLFRGTAAGTIYHIDLARCYDSTFKISNLLANVTAISDLKLRIRQEGYNNYYNGFKLNSVIAPAPALDTFQLTATDSVMFSNPTQGGINTIPGAAVANSGLYAQLSAGNVPTTNSFAIMLDFVCPSTIDGNIRGLYALGTSSFNLSSVNTISMYIFNGGLYFRSLGPTAAGESTYQTTDPSFVAKYAGKRIKLLVVRDGGIAPVVYINGHETEITLVLQAGGRTWASTITADYLLVGFQNTGLASLASTIYYSAALFNYAPNAAKAQQFTTIGLIGTDQWGTNFGGGTNGCIGYWDFENGGGVSIFDQSPFAQTATITGTATRLQNSVKKVYYRTNAGSPSGVLTPQFIGEEVLNTSASVWFKATGLTNTNWVALN